MTRPFAVRNNPQVGDRFHCWNTDWVITAITGAMDGDGYYAVEAKELEGVKS